MCMIMRSMKHEECRPVLCVTLVGCVYYFSNINNFSVLPGFVDYCIRFSCTHWHITWCWLKHEEAQGQEERRWLRTERQRGAVK